MESKCPDETGHVQDDVNPHILCMFEGTFSFDMAQVIYCIKNKLLNAVRCHITIISKILSFIPFYMVSL